MFTEEDLENIAGTWSLEGVSLAPARMFSTSPSTGAVLGALMEGMFLSLVSGQTLSPTEMGEAKLPDCPDLPTEIPQSFPPSQSPTL